MWFTYDWFCTIFRNVLLLITIVLLLYLLKKLVFLPEYFWLLFSGLLVRSNWEFTVPKRSNHKTKLHMKSSSCCYFNGDFLSVLSLFSLSKNSMISSTTNHSVSRLLSSELTHIFLEKCQVSACFLIKFTTFQFWWKKLGKWQCLFTFRFFPEK